MTWKTSITKLNAHDLKPMMPIRHFNACFPKYTPLDNASTWLVLFSSCLDPLNSLKSVSASQNRGSSSRTFLSVAFYTPALPIKINMLLPLSNLPSFLSILHQHLRHPCFPLPALHLLPFANSHPAFLPTLWSILGCCTSDAKQGKGRQALKHCADSGTQFNWSNQTKLAKM